MPAKKPTSAKSVPAKTAKSKTVPLPKVKPESVSEKAAKSKAPTPRAAKTKPAAISVAKPERTDVFVSYSHADKEWLTRLLIHLKPLERDHKIAIWADTKLRGGDKWRGEIDKALTKAKVAVLLVSADFMASDFIAGNELPPLLKAAEKDGVLILPIIVGHSGGFTISSLSQFQALNDPMQPLEDMLRGEANKVFTQVFKQVYAAFQQPDLKPVQRAKAITTESPTTTNRSKELTRPVTATLIKKPANRSNDKKALLVKRNGEWEVITVAQSQLATDLTLVVKATTIQQRVFLMSLRQADQLGVVVLGFQSYVCKNAEVQIKTEGRQETWHIKTDLQQQNRRAQVTFSSITPDMQAESRARLLFLNEPIPSEQSYYRHMSIVVNYESSPFPALYQQLNKQAEPFKQIAPLIATLLLQVNNIVEHILKLTLSLKGSIMTVRFEGERSSQYQTDQPKLIKVEGTCDLSKPTAEKVLRLGPLNRY